MELKELRKIVDVPEDIEVNHMAILEHKFFNEHGSGDNYRDKAIDFALNNKLTIGSTANNCFNILRRFVSITCPVCGKQMLPDSGGGNGDLYNMEYNCPDKHGKASISIPLDGFYFQRK